MGFGLTNAERQKKYQARCKSTEDDALDAQEIQKILNLGILCNFRFSSHLNSIIRYQVLSLPGYHPKPHILPDIVPKPGFQAD